MGTADENFYREREQKALIEELTGLLVRAVNHEAANRQSTNSSSRRADLSTRPDGPWFSHVQGNNLYSAQGA